MSILSTYPSYLGQLVEEGLRRGYRPVDFGLQRIIIGGELVSDGLMARSQRLFGPVHFDEAYAMTETWPLSGQRCAQGHLHFEPGQGLVEIVDPETGAPVPPGEAGTIVATPFPPYRETTILLRYDTEDIARPIAGSLTCDLRTLQATTNILGKLRLSLRHDRGWTYPRDLLEVFESIEEIPLPARFGFWAVPDGVAVEVVTRKTGVASVTASSENSRSAAYPCERSACWSTRVTSWIPFRCAATCVKPRSLPSTTALPAVDSGLLRAGC